MKPFTLKNRNDAINFFKKPPTKQGKSTDLAYVWVQAWLYATFYFLHILVSLPTSPSINLTLINGL